MHKLVQKVFDGDRVKVGPHDAESGSLGIELDGGLTKVVDNPRQLFTAYDNLGKSLGLDVVFDLVDFFDHESDIKPAKILIKTQNKS